MARPRKPPATAEAEPDVAARIRDRIVEFRRVPAVDLQDNERNWRTHPYAQRVALNEILAEVGITDALLAYNSERAGGKLTLIDGHLRREDNDDLDWPVLITDLTDEEADLVLSTFDPLASMAKADASALSSLIDDVRTGTPGLEDLMRDSLAQAEATEAAGGLEGGLTEFGSGGPDEMELQAFEHYDYIMLLFRNALDWQQAKELFGLKNEGFTLRDGTTRKVGLGRVVDGKKALEILNPRGAERPTDREA